MTVQRLIDLSFFDMGQIASGASASADESSDALAYLNQILSSWSAERLTCYNRKHYAGLSLPLGTTSFTIGPAASWATTARPTAVEGVIAYSGNFRRGMEIVSMEEFSKRSQAPSGMTEVLPGLIGVDNAYPALNARVFPASNSGCSVDLHTLEPLTAFAALSDVIDLPPAYEHALRLALAVELYPQYAREKGIDPVLAGNAQAAKAVIAAMNAGMVAAPPQAA